jgi:hypothetical protein
VKATFTASYAVKVAFTISGTNHAADWVRAGAYSGDG